MSIDEFSIKPLKGQISANDSSKKSLKYFFLTHKWFISVNISDKVANLFDDDDDADVDCILDCF